MVEPAVRLRALQNQIRRLGSHLRGLEARHRRFSWYRLMLFAGTLILAFSVAVWSSSAAGLLVLVVGLTAFGVLAFFHRRIEQAYRRHAVWSRIKAEQQARATLDWNLIPAGSPPAEPASHPFASDLDLVGPRSVHELLNIAVSADGSRLLENWLTVPEPDPAVFLDRQGTVRELVPLARFRDKLLLALRMHTGGRLDGEKLRKWLQSHSELVPPVILIAASVLVACNYLLIVASAEGWLTHPYWELSLAAYFAFYLARSRQLWPVLYSAVSVDDQLSNLGRVLAFLETYPCGCHHRLADLCALFRNPKSRPSRQIRRVKLLTLLAGLRMNPIVGVILNLLLPWDFLVVHLLAARKMELTAIVPAWLDRCSELEALLSLSNLGYLNPNYSFPEIKEREGRNFEAVEIGHPLIEPGVRVCNDFSLGNTQVIVLTGSNMSGKSTFIKTLGVNLALAQAGGPVCASRLTVYSCRIFACIRLVDSVQDHVSTFYAEVRRLRQLLNALGQPSGFPLFFLIDEIFRGTNNRERLLGSQAFLEALLGKNGAGVITTHDLDLAHSADRLAGVRNHHFREEIVGDRMVFDYRLRAGICPTTNALKIMQMEGLPVPE